jgi:hypothetical protein
MRKLAGDRGIEAARDAQAPAAAPPHETSGQAKRRRVRQAETRTKDYLAEMRRA